MKLLRNLTTSFIVTSMIFLGSFVAHGYITISDTFTINFDSSGSSDVPYTGHYAGNNEYSYNYNVAANSSATFTVNVTSVTGNPDMVIVMVDPNSGAFWAIDDPKTLELGENTVDWGPFGDPVGLKYMIRVDADDSVTFDSFVATDGSGSSGSGDSGSGSSSGSGVTITDPVSIDFTNGVTGTTDIAYDGSNAGNNKYSYGMNVSSGGSVTFDLNATSVTGDPKMVITMWNPNNNSEYWAATAEQDIVAGANSMTWGPFDADVHIKFEILLDSDDAVSFDSYVVGDGSDGSGGATGGNISITDAVSIDFNNGVTGTTDVVYTGSHEGENQYAYSINVGSGESVTYSVNATSVTGDPRMQILMFNASNNSEYWAASDSVDIVAGTNNLSWGPFNANVHLKFTILLDSDDAVSFDNFTVTETGDTSGGGGSSVTNGVRFVFESESGGNPAYSFETDSVEITGNSSQSYSITIPAYTDTGSGNTFSSMLLYAIGEDQSIVVSDVTLTVDGVTYGGSGSNSLLFNNIFGGVDIDEDTFTYTFLSTSESWGGFALSTAQANALPTNGLVFDSDATLTFSANLSDGAVTLPPEYDGETAFSNGSIDTSEDTGTGRDGDAPYRWSAYTTWFNLEAGDTQGSWAGGDAWSWLSDLPATWDNGVITLGPNTASFDAWSDEGEDDGNKFLEQTLKIEGDRGTSAILGNTVNLSGTVDSYTLDSRYTVTAFIKALDPNNNYTAIVESQVVLSSAGNFAISADLPAGDYVPQLGFLLSGRNANPATDWGNIQISNVSASYDGTSSIPEGNFSNGSNGYWTAVTGVEFNTSGGYGSVPGQVVMTNTGTNRSSVYIGSNTNNWQDLSQFGMEAGTTYDVSYYMNRISGSDLGAVQFAFNVNGSTVYVPSDTTVAFHDDSSTVNGEWAQYSQAIEVPENATQAVLYVLSGAQSVIAFDQITATAQVATNDFASWAADNGLTGSDAAFDADPDNDGVPNGLESFLGTAPGTRSGGMSNITKTSNGISMQHSHNSDLSTDITASYEWSTDLSTWNASGATVDGTTVTIATEDSNGTTTATATLSGTEVDNVFIKVSVSNE